MSTKKTIQINPQLFSMSGKKNKTEKKRPSKEKMDFKPNSLKRELMKRIKSHAVKSEKQQQSVMKNSADMKSNDNFSNDFDKHMGYLNNLSKEQKHEKRKNNRVPRSRQHTTRRNKSRSVPMNNPPSAFLDLPPELNEKSFTINIDSTGPSVHLNEPFQREPPYGCLKGGGKPTFKDWKRTTQKAPISFDNHQINTGNMDDISNEPLFIPQQRVQSSIRPSNTENSIQPVSNLKINPMLNMPNEREKRLEGVKEKFKRKTENDEINTTIQKKKIDKQPRTFKYNKTIKRTYGKGHGKISVCIKDAQTRKNIIQEQIELRKTPINEVKEYLKNKYLIKSGSHAPNDILRRMYEDTHLAGDIMNKNEDNLLHNYINTEE